MTAFLWHANSGNLSEKVSKLYLGFANAKVVFSLALPSLNAGDLIQAWASCEVTNDLKVNVMVARCLKLSTSPTGTFGTEISEGAARNITPGNHHDVIQDFGSYQMTSGSYPLFLNFVVWADRTGRLATDFVKVAQDYGRLMVNAFDAAAVK
jgi:hypothetical protein